ncbi:MAG: penicillin acylase family protein [Ardenticatenales bacterium]|nr:penicillin acylase family protein [Ardenticatenales bacterium]
MNRLARVLLILVSLLLAVVVVVAGILIYTVRRPFPKTNGNITVTGLQAEVNIYRDEYGIPHIYAQNADDLFFAEGYVHAQDRFWQMEFWRHIAFGRLSEMVGDATLDTDTFIRTVGFNRISEATLAMYEQDQPEALHILEAYSAGVNAYLAQHKDDFSLTQTLLGLQSEPWEIEPWTPLDTIGWATVMSWDLSGNWQGELARADLLQKLGPEKTAELRPFYPENRPVIAPDAKGNAGLPVPAVVEQVDWSRVNMGVLAGMPANGLALGNGPFVGSNNWVVSGEHTATGMPLLADDPHLSIQMPSIWYEVGLHAPGWDVVGFSFAGTPGVIIGHNNKIAWGVTNVGPDVQDLFIEKLNPDNPDQYEFEGEWQDMTIIPEVIRVNGGDDVTVNVRLTRHGPLMNDVVDELSNPLALQWATAEPSRLLLAILGLNQAQDYEEFRDAMQYWDTAAQNTVYADVEGNIAYQMPGRVPLRKAGDGTVPVPGWTGEYEWDGWIPYEALPALYNPDSGFIVTANNAVVGPDYPYLIEKTWANGDRAQRITDMIAEVIATRPINAEDFGRIHMDSKSLLAESYVPLLTGLSSSDADVQAALERLRGWDLQERRDSVPAALFEIFFMNLARDTIADDIGGDITDGRTDAAISFVFFHKLAQEPDSPWWDNVNTGSQESRDDVILQAMGETIDWFQDNLGGSMNDWTWGRIHDATFVSDPLGQSGISLLESMVNRGPFPADGGSSLVNATGWSYGDPAHVTWHPSMRMIVDLSNLDDSLSVIPTGQSGHPYNKHYDDEIALWLNGQYHPMRFSEEAVQQAVQDHLVLQPGP